ncbi:MAG: hypothetical protein IPL73_22440 [Candidatus Obscuribacter sp.]|jgi:SAM-dependent methyltransferase|nr:hypothetical protein [Candidatus Obscuribacter sp.]
MTEKTSDQKLMTELFVISAASLYFELAIIRWLSSEIRIFAYFKNIPLMACLFGLGLGMAMSRSKTNLFKWFPIGLCVLIGIICVAGHTVVNPIIDLTHVTFINPLENYLIGNFGDGQVHNELWYRVAFFMKGLTVLVGVFYLIVLTFSGMGQKIGELFEKFDSLKAYSVNVFASLVGILLFTIVSYCNLTPPIWLVIGVVPMLAFYRKPLQIGALLLSLVFAFALNMPNVRWSPYYRISVSDIILPADGDHPAFKYGSNINVNYDTIEGAYDNRPEAIAKLSEKQKAGTADYYDTPYIALGDKPRSVLVLAAGTGNDVAAALRHGATDVDCVEIDPYIAKLGKEIHPENPYSDPRVHIIVDDARAYLRRCKKQYDLIVFAYLDSHSAFSSMSSIRLDNYVYTRECFHDASQLLKPKGVMSVIFYYLTWWQLARIYHSVEQGNGAVPIGVYSHRDNGPTLLVGPGLDVGAVKASGLKMFDLADAAKSFNFDINEWKDVNPTTDDWPYVFLRTPGVTWNYAFGLFFTLALGFGLVRKAFGNFTSDTSGRLMFFLGAAFMLIETKSVTQMGLLAGTTWVVNSAVITGVLLMILAANLIQIKMRFKNLDVLFGLLFISIIANYFFDLSTLNGLPTTMSIAVGSLVLSSPLLFAAMIFAISFSKVESASKALGMNLLGTLVGGAFEYLSMMLGIKALNLIALVLYGLAYMYARKLSKSAPVQPIEPPAPDASAEPA